jgi:hypothetical protein
MKKEEGRACDPPLEKEEGGRQLAKRKKAKRIRFLFQIMI